MEAYQFNESKAFALVDKNLSWLPIFGEQSFKVLVCYISRQIPNKQAATLRISLLPRPPQKREVRFKSLQRSRAVRAITVCSCTAELRPPPAGKPRGTSRAPHASTNLGLRPKEPTARPRSPPPTQAPRPPALPGVD